MYTSCSILTIFVPAITYPSIFVLPPKRMWSLGWAIVIFVVINIIIANALTQKHPFERLEYHTSYEDVMAVVKQIRNDPRKKIVFLGGSIVWGNNSANPKNTIPAAFAKHVSKDVSVYNLGIIAGRPLDAYIIMQLLEGDVDLFVMDYNYGFGNHVPKERLIREPATYIRIRQLYNTHAEKMYEDIPGILACVEEYELQPVPKKTAGESYVQRFAEKNIPIFRYKNKLNNAIFGQHPLVLVERIIFEASDVIRGKKSLSSLLKSPVESIVTTSWEPKGTAEEQAFQASVHTTIFAENELNHCLSRAFSTHAAQTNIPLVTYITPNNPSMFTQLHGSEIHNKNTALLTRLFAGTRTINLDDGSIAGKYFADSAHFIPEGNHKIAEQLFAAMFLDLISLELLHHNSAPTNL